MSQVVEHAAGPAPRRSDDGEPLGEAAASIARGHPWVPPERIDALLRASYERTRDARVQIYRLVLAERNVRAQLRREQRDARGPATSVER